MSPTVFVTPIALTLLVSAPFLGRKNMQPSEATRLSYRLAFPTDLTTEHVARWMTSVSGTLTTGPRRLLGVPTMVFEVSATDHGIVHGLKVPREHARYIVPQLRSLVPGMTVTPAADEEPPVHWTTAAELGQTNPNRSLSILDAAALSASILAGMQGLGADEALLLQWVVTPALQERPPRQGREVRSSRYSLVGQLLVGSAGADKDEIADRRAKLSEPNFLGVLRIAARASDKRQADRLLAPLRSSLASVRSPDNRFRKRLVSSSRVVQRVAAAAPVTIFPAQLAVTELVGLLAWPIGQPHIAGLPVPEHAISPPPVPSPAPAG